MELPNKINYCSYSFSNVVELSAEMRFFSILKFSVAVFTSPNALPQSSSYDNLITAVQIYIYPYIVNFDDVIFFFQSVIISHKQWSQEFCINLNNVRKYVIYVHTRFSMLVGELSLLFQFTCFKRNPGARIFNNARISLVPRKHSLRPTDKYPHNF